MSELHAAIPYVLVGIFGAGAGICRAFADKSLREMSTGSKVLSGVIGGWLGFIAVTLVLPHLVPDRTPAEEWGTSAFCGLFGPEIKIFLYDKVLASYVQRRDKS